MKDLNELYPDAWDDDLYPQKLQWRVDAERSAYKAGYTQAVTDLSAENEKLMEALRNIVLFTDEMQNAKTDFDYNMSSAERKAAIIRAKQLITEEK